MKSAPITREEVALKMAESYGVKYFNPFIGNSAADTCGSLNEGFTFLHHVLNRGVAEEIQPCLSLLVQTMWAAAQFEMEAGELSKGGAA